jgi:hypothetical protein
MESSSESSSSSSVENSSESSSSSSVESSSDSSSSSSSNNSSSSDSSSSSNNSSDSSSEVTATEGLIYKLVDYSYYRVIGYEGTDTEVVIPATYEGKPVTYIEEEAFKKCKEITSVTMPQSIVGIGKNAFFNCVALESIEIPEGVIRIEENAFTKCTALQEVSLPSTLEYMGIMLFANCPLTELEFRGTVAEWSVVIKEERLITDNMETNLWSWKSKSDILKVVCADGEVEKILPDMEITTYRQHGEEYEFADVPFRLSDFDGELIMLYFFTTNDQSSVDMLLQVENFAYRHDIASRPVNVIAINADLEEPDISEFLTDGYLDYRMQFGQDDEEINVYEELGGNGQFPLTVLLDETRTVVAMSYSTMMYNDIVYFVNQYLNI